MTTQIAVARPQGAQVWRRPPDLHFQTVFNLFIDTIREAAGKNRAISRELFQDCLQLLKENSKDEYLSLLKTAFWNWIYQTNQDVSEGIGYLPDRDHSNCVCKGIESFSNCLDHWLKLPSPPTQKRLVLTEKDLYWTEEFLKVVENQNQELKRSVEIFSLSKKFENVAIEYAKKIIEEVNLDDCKFFSKAFLIEWAFFFFK